MKILYFDCFSGISGDMAIGALLDLGIDEALFRQELAKLNISGYELVACKKVINGITSTDFSVVLDQVDKCSNSQGDGHGSNTHSHEQGHENGGHQHSLEDGHEDGSHQHYHEQVHDGHIHRHEVGHNEHTHSHEQGHNDHTHSHGHAGQSHNNSERNLRDIEKILDYSSLNAKVKDFSKKVFREIAMAEAKVHGKDIFEVHFHEVGAIDSIVDIVGTAICLDMLGIEKVFSSPLHDGSGFIECRHGVIPVPVPAVMEMLSGSGIPLISENIGTELVTPTGMALIKCLASGFGNMPAMTVEKTGYGMGKRDTGRLNALRVVMGTVYEQGQASSGSTFIHETESSGIICENTAASDLITVLETNIDDMSPEILGYTAGRLFESGALDVFYTPIYMKKNRPAFMLTVLTDKKNEEKLVDMILKETTTLGIRKTISARYCMKREIIKVNTEWGEVRVKAATKGDFKKAAPEYEDCRAIAEKTGLPLKKVYEAVLRIIE